jgi:hypothetical protein
MTTGRFIGISYIAPGLREQERAAANTGARSLSSWYRLGRHHLSSDFQSRRSAMTRTLFFRVVTMTP